jgi:cyclopropane-fatty-acyl-phospholipid synthase
MSLKRWVTNTLNLADIEIGGDRPWDVRVNNGRFYRRAARGALGLGEAYMDRDWDVDALDAFFRHVIRSDLASSAIARLNRAWLVTRARLQNLQNPKRARAVAESHYDLDHRLYEQILGPYNQYTCCFFDGTDALEEAEVIKLRMICNKLELGPEDRVLDIGCGWGGFARFAAAEVGCSVTGITLSESQAAYAREFTSGLPVDIVICDYRDLPEKIEGRFDKVLICGMIEHVGYKNYRSLMQVVSRMMKEDGLFLLHTIGNRDETKIVDPWIEKYIFRNSMIPSMRQLAGSIANLFVVQDWENYGHYYSKTLEAWQRNFERNWETIRSIRSRHPFDERFRRLWNYYLMSSKAAFDVESLLLWQIVMSRAGCRDSVYERVNLRT